MKAILVILDGLGDRPVKELKNLTPLEAAHTPNLDKAAKEGTIGLMDTLGVGVRPGSDVAHCAIFGYDPVKDYPGRGPFEVLGIGMDLKKGDVAFRANVGTLDANGIIIDRRAGRIASTREFAQALNGMKINGVQFLLKEGTGHRVGLVMRGKGLSAKIGDADPHEVGLKMKKVLPLDNSKEAAFTAETLNKFLGKAKTVLKNLPINKQRQSQKLLPANCLLVRGAGSTTNLPSLKKKFGLTLACIAGAGLYKGIGRMFGMEVIEVAGANGMPDTDVEAKFKAAVKALQKSDFVFVHVKATDNLAEDGKFKEKKQFIEKVDKAFKVLMGSNKFLVAVTADHSTPCILKAHSGDPVPLLFYGPGLRVDSRRQFGERACAQGGAGRIKGLDLMNELLNLMGRQKLVGN